MFRLDANRPARFCDGLRRRDFLHAGALAGLGLGLPDFLRLRASGAVADQDRNCILLFLVGGPSHLDTWDMKPDAPAEIRGPYRPIKTNVPGIEISEIFPRMARHADKFAIVRSVCHTAAAVHETGHQLMQTGRLFEEGIKYPHFGCALSRIKGARGDVPAHVLLPAPIGETGSSLPHGQDGGYLGRMADPVIIRDGGPSGPEGLTSRWRVDDTVRRLERSGPPQLSDSIYHAAYTMVSSGKARDAFDVSSETPETRARYGRNRFGEGCLLARRLVEAGVRFVTVNMFDTVFNEITWDIHGYHPFSPIGCYRDLVGPMFDMAYSSLLTDLKDRGLLENTMVLAMGEFGRTPKINPAGGRDHWPECWSVLMAGGPIVGGQIIGASDARGGEPKSRPVTPGDLAATVYHGLGVPLETEFSGPQGSPVALLQPGAQPVRELFV